METATELDALNVILSALGEMPVNTLDSGLPVALISLQTLRRQSRAIQTQGWWFNEDYSYRLIPDVEGRITVKDALSLRPAGDNAWGSYPRDIVLRGNRVYDRANRSYTFDDPVHADVIWHLPWDELPFVFRDYVALRAARQQTDDTRNSQVLHEFNRRNELEAYRALNEANIDAASENSASSYEVQLIAGRRFNPWR